MPGLDARTGAQFVRQLRLGQLRCVRRYAFGEDVSFGGGTDAGLRVTGVATKSGGIDGLLVLVVRVKEERGGHVCDGGRAVLTGGGVLVIVLVHETVGMGIEATAAVVHLDGGVVGARLPVVVGALLCRVVVLGKLLVLGRLLIIGGGDTVILVVVLRLAIVAVTGMVVIVIVADLQFAQKLKAEHKTGISYS